MGNGFMARAIQLAVENVRAGGGGPFGAVVVKDGRVIAEGANSVVGRRDPTAHAEIVAIREACRVLDDFQLTGCEIYTSCEPCPMCLAAIYWARPARIYYGTNALDAKSIGFDDGYIYDELRLPAAERQIPLIEMMREEAWAAFHEWQNNENKIPY